MDKANGVSHQYSQQALLVILVRESIKRLQSLLEFDSSSIDSDHRGLVQLGYHFLTNIRDTVEERADTVIWVEQKYGQDIVCLIHDNAYSPVDGRRLRNYASVWIKRAR
jgi:hypothetical protein